MIKKARVGILFGKSALDQFGCWQDYTDRIVCIKQMTIPKVLEKGVATPANMTTQITLQLKYSQTSFQTPINFQGETMIFVDLIGKCSVFCQLLACFENKYVYN